MNRTQVWIHASRPKTLVAGLSPVLIGTTLALTQGYLQPILFLFTLLTALCIQIGTNLANDYFDFIKGADTAERKGFLRVTQAGLVKPKTMKYAIFYSFILAALCGGYLVWHTGGVVLFMMLAVYILLSIFYTAGPYPLAYKGLGDLLVFVFYGPMAVLITYYLQTHAFSWLPFFVGVCPGALSMAILVVNNVRDIEEDAKANKKTLPVRFGKAFGKAEYLFAIFLSLVPIPFFYSSHPFSLLALLILLPAIPLIRHILYYEHPRELNVLLAKTGQLLWIFTLLFCIGWML